MHFDCPLCDRNLFGLLHYLNGVNLLVSCFLKTMSVDFFLFRIAPDFLKIPSDQMVERMTAETILPFGAQKELIDQLCSNLGFEHDEAEDDLRLERWRDSQAQGLISRDQQPPGISTICYRYHQENDNGRVVTYSLDGDPVICISTNQACSEDFLPIVDVFRELAPFLMFDPTDCEFINPEEFFYSLDDWMQKNYEEDACSFRYE